MKDDTTGNRIEILNDGDAGSYVIVPESQAQKMRDLFKQNDIVFTENSKSIRGGDGNDTIFDFGMQADMDTIQSVLDGAC